MRHIGKLLYKKISTVKVGDTLIYSENRFAKVKPSRINVLDSSLCGNDDFFSVSL